jgi:hypothetical protein
MMSLVFTAKTFSCRPSSFITGLSSYEAYCLDSACTLFYAYMMKEQQEEMMYKSGLSKNIPTKSKDASTWL